MGKTSTGLYESEGKQASRELMLSVARQDQLRTVGVFYGTGIDSRLFAAEGFDVLSAELDHSIWPAMDEDAAANGFTAFHGRARKSRARRDMWIADFRGGASPRNFIELRALADLTDRWLVVVLSRDHQRDETLQGDAALYTIPAWVTGASGFTLEYLTRYVRNQYGQTMFVAMLQRRDGRGNSHRVQPLQIAMAVADRGYWASKPMHDMGILPHRTAMTTWRRKETIRNYYREHRPQRLASTRKWRENNLERSRDVSRAWRAANPEKARAADRRWREAHRDDPGLKDKRREASRRWYLANRDKAIEQARQSRLRKKLAAVSGTAAEAVNSEIAA